MTIFLCPTKRFRQALEALDPLPKVWFIRILDPWPTRNRTGELPWSRISIIISFLFGPLWLFSSIPAFGGKLFGKGGMATDWGMYTHFLFGASALVLIPIARRLLGDLMNELVALGVSRTGSRHFSPAAVRGTGLRFLEWFSRLSGYRALPWMILILLEQLFAYHGDLSDGVPTWTTSGATPGTLFHIFAVGDEQPNIAGLWYFLLFGPTIGYLVVVVARLIIVFACLCKQLARSDGLTIIPSHPDGTGGLNPVGQVALFFSLFSFLVGIDLAGVSLNRFILHTTVLTPTGNESTPLLLIVLSWWLYLVVATLLFFLPIAPLRDRMAEAKRQYLIEALRLHSAAERKHRNEVRETDFEPNSLQGLVALDVLIQKASEMAVWPFDKKTFRRYAGLLISPLALFLAERLPFISTALRSYLRLP